MPSNESIRRRRRLAPAETLVIGFAVMIAIGTVLLQLPVSARRAPLTFLEALFTATSATCVTGLTVIDPGSTLTAFGQAVLLLLIQCGGLGFMTLTSAVFSAAHARVSLTSRMVLRDALNESSFGRLRSLTQSIMSITLVCELTGAVILAMRFVPDLGLGRGLWTAVFTSISAFCNAGFDIFGLGTSLMPYAADVLVNVTIMALIVLGGLGFFVIIQVAHKLAGEEKRTPWSLHTRVVLLLSGLLILIGAVLFALMEWDNPATFGNPAYSPARRILEATFQSVTTRTAGFASFDQAAMRPVSKMISIALMFIGASPAGTGGGFKTTTAAVVVAFVVAVLKGRKDVNLLKRRINEEVARRAMAMFFIGILVVSLVSCLISIMEPAQNLTDIIFEAASAFGTVGLTAGVTPQLGTASLVILILTMFGGRVGFFTLSLALAYRFSTQETHVRYAEERVMIG